VQIDSEFILNGWKQAKSIPGGKIIFSLMIKKLIPYTGALKAQIVKLEKGNVELRLKDRKGVRNHLSSIHAMALANLGEFSTGLAIITGLPPKRRAILKGFEIEYLKKARGTLSAKSSYTHKDSNEESQDIKVMGDIFNAEGEIVAQVKALWRVGAIK
jgi:acyl-coenzyme A thioesterase PaaI-like protein